MSDSLPPAQQNDTREPRSLAAFFAARWRGEVSLGQLLWRDMMFVGTAINVFTGFAGLMLFANDAPTAVAAAVYFLPTPYNVFLFAALWRTAAAGSESFTFANLARLLGFGWLVAATLF